MNIISSVSRSIFVVFKALITVFVILAAFSSALAATVSQLSEGKIENKTSIIVEVENTTQAIDLPIKKDGKDLVVNWTLAADKTFQYLNIEPFGLGEFEISLATVERKSGLTKREIITVHEASPSIRVIGSGPFINASGNRSIPVEAINAVGVSVSVYKVNDMPELFSQYYYTNTLRSWRANRLRKSFDHQTDFNFKLAPAHPNQSQLVNLTLPKELENGWYILAIKPSNAFDDPDIIHVLLSDIGLQAKVFDKNMSLQAIDLATGLPLSDGEVFVIGKKGVRTTTALNKGFVQLEYAERDVTDIIMVKHKQRTAFLPMKEVALDLSDFEVKGAPQHQLEAFTFSNRDLFKPRETVTTNIVLREISGELSKEKRVYVEVVKPNGKVALSQFVDETIASQTLAAESASEQIAANKKEISNKVAGLFSFAFQIPEHAPLGKWTLKIKTHPNQEKEVGKFFFTVGEFIPERMDLEIDVPSQISANTQIPVSASGRYLFGQLAAGNRFVSASSLYSLTHFSGEFSSYFVGKRHYIPSYYAPKLVELRLDDQGKAHFELDKIASEGLDGPATLTLSNQLFEAGGATTTRVNRLVVSNDKSIVGIKPHAEHFNYFDDAQFSLLLLDHYGSQALEGKVNLKFEHNRGGYYWIYNENSGWDLRRDNKWRLVEFKQLNLTNTPTELSLPVEWGDYRMTATSPDGQETIYEFYVGWRESEKQRPVKPDQLAMSLDKTSYQNGGVIEAKLSSPISGVVSFELVGDRTYLNQQVVLSGNEVTAEIPVPKDLDRHDLYLIATLVNTEQSYTRRLLAVEPVHLYRDDRRIQVEITAPKKFEPFTTQTVKVKVRNSKDANAKVLTDPYVVLTIADKGILNLSRYRVPDIFDAFYGQKRLSGDIIDLYSRQFEARPASFIKHRYGGDSDVTSNAPLDNLVESKTFNQVFAPVALNAEGESVIEVNVPDYNGEVQLVATIIDGSRFGYGVEDVTVSAPIVAELSVPRFFATNSTSQAMIEVSNQTDEKQVINLALTANNAVSLTGTTQRKVELEPNQKLAFPVAIRVGEMIGISTLALHIESNVYSVKRNWTVPVRSATPYVTKQRVQKLAAGDTLAITQAQWNGLLPIFNGKSTVFKGKSTVTFSHAPAINPLPFAQGLYRYPYGCVEQTTSKAFPWLIKEESLQPLKQEVLEGRSQKAMLIDAIARLESAQNSRGGFGLWSKQSQEEAWLTTYVTDFLLATLQAYPDIVSKQMIDLAINRTRFYLTNNQTSVDDRVYIGFVLASHNRLTYADAATHLKNLLPSNSLSAARLGATFYLLGDAMAGSKALASSRQMFANGLNKINGNYYESEVTAFGNIINIISFIERIMPIDNTLHSYRIDVAERLIETFETRRYYSTQEKLALTKAGFNLQQLNTKQVPMIHNGEALQTSAPIALVNGDTFINSSDAAIYVTESVEGFADPQQLTSSADYQYVKRSYLTPQGKAITSNRFKVGDTIVVKVEFKLSTAMPQGMMIDYLPAGMVIEHPDYTASADILATLAAKNSDSEMIEYRNDRFVTAGNYADNQHYEFHYVMRAETPGEVAIPKAYIEDMHQPERFIYEKAMPFEQLVIEP